jgi:hypothetical protein
MTTTDSRVVPALPPDPGIPGARGLFREDGAEVLGRFLSTRSWSLVEARPVQVSYRPERSCLVRYRARATNPDGHPRVLTLTAETRHRQRPSSDPPTELEDRYGLPRPVERIGPYLVWAYPYDPSLEGLPDAAWGPSVRERLRAAGRPLRAVAVQPLRYRPRRRAVFRYTGLHGGRGGAAPQALFGKVLPGAKVERWRKVLPPRRRGLRVPVPLGSGDRGVLLFASLEGRSLRDLLLSGGSLPAPERLAALLDELPRVLGSAPGERDRNAPLRTASATAELVQRLIPQASAAVARLQEAVAEGVALDNVPSRTVHGDLYEAQVFVGRDYSLGLIDLDDSGPGDPAMDAANFAAHLIALALAVPHAGNRIMAYRSLVRSAFVQRLGVSPRELAWREALCLFALSTGPFRVLRPAWPAEVRRRAEVALRLAQAT